MPTDPQAWLDAFLARHGGVAGTVHRTRPAPGSTEGDLVLVAWSRLPPQVVEIVRHVPRGKGMAGRAQVERRPFQTCDLKTDPSPTVRPGARQVDGRAAVALPLVDADGATRAVVGISFAHEGTLPDEQVARLLADAATLPESAA